MHFISNQLEQIIIQERYLLLDSCLALLIEIQIKVTHKELVRLEMREVEVIDKEFPQTNHIQGNTLWNTDQSLSTLANH